jgi:hypothetical protein
MMPTKDEMLSFAKDIEKIVSTTDYNYIEAVVEYCNETGMELDVASSLINSTLKSKIENDAMDLNLLPKKARLPF